jgi:hypothetical protein
VSPFTGCVPMQRGARAIGGRAAGQSRRETLPARADDGPGISQRSLASWRRWANLIVRGAGDRHVHAWAFAVQRAWFNRGVRARPDPGPRNRRHEGCPATREGGWTAQAAPGVTSESESFGSVALDARCARLRRCSACRRARSPERSKARAAHLRTVARGCSGRGDLSDQLVLMERWSGDAV